MVAQQIDGFWTVSARREIPQTLKCQYLDSLKWPCYGGCFVSVTPRACITGVLIDEDYGYRNGLRRPGGRGVPC